VSGILGERGESAGNGNLLNSGMDSLRALSIRNALQKRLGVLLPMSVFFDNPTVGGLVDELVARMNFQ
jgi:acyl carrier protein